MDSDRQRWWYTLEIVEVSNGEIHRGTIYINLHQLLEDGLITGRKETAEDGFVRRYPDQIHRRVQKITQKGTRRKVEEGTKEKPRSLLDRFLPEPDPELA